MMSIFPKIKSGYVLLSAIIFLFMLSGLVFQIERHRQSNIALQSNAIEANNARILCNILILKRTKNKECTSLKSSIGTIELSNKNFAITLSNGHHYKFSESDEPL
ncbi:hypothetical protein EFN70_08520 [Pediococcus ethanolidurans]|nr:hypothetical protein [Pediococcus ethanolidurans]